MLRPGSALDLNRPGGPVDKDSVKTAVILIAIAAGLLAIDRAALWAEARGWIYWRRRKRVGGQIGAAVAAELGGVLSPAERTRQEVILRAEQLPAPDDPGGAPNRPRMLDV